MNPLNNITEQQLDDLLKEVYLETNSNKLNEQDANLVFGKSYAVIINTDKEKELLQKLMSVTKTNKNNQWFYFLLLALGLIIGVVAYFYVQKHSNKFFTTNYNQDLVIQKDVQLTSTENNSLIDNKATIFIKEQDTFPKITSKHTTLVNDSAFASKTHVPQQIVEQTLPYLTKKDKVNYRNIKEQLLRNLSSLNKFFYTKIPANKINYANKPLIINEFSMRNMAVSNLEYKVFLSDLISQNRTADYFKAEVFSETWSKYHYYQIAASYFQDEKYNDFPVVNITKEAAVLFCKWLQEELELYTIQHQIKNTGIQIRLPYSEEWISATRDGYAKIVFEKGYHTMYDETEGLVDKAFANRQEKIRDKNKQSDSLYHYFITNHFGMNKTSILNSLNRGLNYYPYPEIDTLNPTKMKVLNKLYKVSEIVILKNSNQSWFSGQTWRDKEEYQQFEQEFENNSCSPFVGFRFVVINPNAPEYKNPFW